MAEASLASLRERRAVTIEWRAFELRPGGRFPGTPEEEDRYRQFILKKHEPMWAIARERFGLAMTEGPWGVNTRPALEGAYYAREQDLEQAYHQACFSAHWQQTRRLDDLDTLVEIAVSVGLEAEGFGSAVANRVYQPQVESDLWLAGQFGINGIPAMIFGGRYLVSGAQTVDVLEQVVDRCVAEGLVAPSPDG